MDDLWIRMAGEDDSDDILAIYAPYVENTSITFEVEVPGSAEFLSRLRKIKSKYPYLVAGTGESIIGFAYAAELMERAAYQWNAGLSVYLRDGFSGCGLGTVLYRALIEFLKLQRFQSVYGVVTAPNPGSEKLHRKLGFKQVGRYEKAGYKCGSWHDVLFFEKHIGDHGDRPEPPRPVSAITDADLADILTGALAGRLVKS